MPTRTPMPRTRQPARGAHQTPARAAIDHAAARQTLGDLTDAYQWAVYARTLAHHGTSAAEQLDAAVLLAPLAALIGHADQAFTTYRDLVDLATAALGASHERTLHARAGLAAAHHRIGRCEQAIRDLADVYTTAERRHGPEASATLKALTQLACLYRDCGSPDISKRCLTVAATIAARYLTIGDPLRTQISDIARMPASENHRAVCTQLTPSWPVPATSLAA
ncbi:tetratricopeptide repeat protein [Micromonospora sp. STR1_7]|uniref:Tetratricopeptide repeat protein n=1 Tax=Micromonospora parastrephiae TaxID=2806101 RepID=A0ABS1XMI8_9ACTN|nr:tetratricopeptide repeat protein [Micromonospora parastrephiae]MBM0230443.1 tetratricopeptide repeat protein [Micromonospora parastrephiae]